MAAATSPANLEGLKGLRVCEEIAWGPKRKQGGESCSLPTHPRPKMAGPRSKYKRSAQQAKSDLSTKQSGTLGGVHLHKSLA